MTALKTIVSFLDRELNTGGFKDDCHNGLQVENSGTVRRICTGVDASLPFFERAAERKADLVICHHGLSWGDSLRRITDLNYRRLKFLLDHDMALYACHLPLDAHPRHGNNALICKALGLRELKPFGVYHGVPIGFRGALPKPMPYHAFKRRAQAVFGRTADTMDFGRKQVRTVAVVSGGAANQISEAGECGVDVYVSGEPNLAAFNLAQEYGINAIFAGHYATETFGVEAVAALLSRRYRMPVEFIDMRIHY
jgi:dinuclear metal center YbgI/SA1388 family protein